MQSFSTFISEAVATSSLQVVGNIIKKYFARKLQTPLVRLPGVEAYTKGGKKYHSIRFFTKAKPFGGTTKYDSIRFNWVNTGMQSSDVDSVDLFAKGKHLYNMRFVGGTSMVKILPYVYNFVQGRPQTGTVSFVNTDSINEANGSQDLKKVSELLVQNNMPVAISRSKLYNFFGQYVNFLPRKTSHEIFDAVTTNFPQLASGSGSRVNINIGGGKLADIADALADVVFTKAVVKKGSKAKEQYEGGDFAEKMEAKKKSLPRLAFEEQINSLRTAITMLVNNVTNAVFIGGRGGIGKTHNVEGKLNELGLTDENGYYKNAGSVSAAGLYRLLYKNRHKGQIVLFDDSDSVFGDQEARNILKGATDTKAKRKIAWNKKAPDIMDADIFDDDAEAEGMFPNRFEFEAKILFISNLKIDKLDPDGAIRTRAIMVEIDPTDEEVYAFMAKIIDDFDLPEGLSLTHAQRLEVLEVMKSNPQKEPNFRTLDRALKMRAGGDADFDWKKFVIYYA